MSKYKLNRRGWLTPTSEDQEEFEQRRNNVKRMIANAETLSSKDPYTAINEDSGALGKYQFIPLYNPDIVKKYPHLQDFLKNPQAQEDYMNSKIPEYWGSADKLKKKYPELTKNYSMDELASLVHFQGEKGLEAKLTSGKMNKSTKINPSPTSYLNRTQGKYEMGGDYKLQKYENLGEVDLGNIIKGNELTLPKDTSPYGWYGLQGTFETNNVQTNSISNEQSSLINNSQQTAPAKNLKVPNISLPLTAIDKTGTPYAPTYSLTGGINNAMEQKNTVGKITKGVFNLANSMSNYSNNSFANSSLDYSRAEKARNAYTLTPFTPNNSEQDKYGTPTFEGGGSFLSNFTLMSPQKLMEDPKTKQLMQFLPMLLEEGGEVCEECEEFEKGGWIQSAVKHPGRCTPGSPNYDCPKGSPQWNLAQRFKHGDLHKHEEGGYTEGEVYDLTPEEIQYLKSQGYQIEIE